MTEQDLLDLKKKVDEAKSKVSELTGHKAALMRQLEDDWECSTVDEAEKKIRVQSKELDKLDQLIEEKIEKLKTKYNIEE